MRDAHASLYSIGDTPDPNLTEAIGPLATKEAQARGQAVRNLPLRVSATAGPDDSVDLRLALPITKALPRSCQSNFAAFRYMQGRPVLVGIGG